MDLALFAILAAIAFVGSWRMRVYFRVTVAEVQAARIDADGSRHPIEVPANFTRTLIGDMLDAKIHERADIAHGALLASRGA